MKKIVMSLCLSVLACSTVFAAEDPLGFNGKSLKDQAFVVESDDESSSDSLNRIAGQYDLGFSSPEQSYDSDDHYRPGPFGREEKADKSQSY